ncbi:GNAT family N-acetyltransferase [Luteibacter aegosomatissinici]|uniref:GNAT family N-acetyltransferase n=1 Tax=Luteibacter aegosomatissinici TaxID=2911539 RepID=UPI001FF8CB6B|nr:GNAT family N-acetyltransferase [Luteibacter aegosomatissinici]UPG93190.1 GNAT family N-acetyltransferase [Luteibacter aegosomatissinici]
MRHTPGITVTTYVGQAILSVVDELAGLRIAVFRDWPYLYDGDRDYERDYLAAYAASPRSVCVVARSPAGEAIGASTGIPLADDGEAFHAPFLAHGMPLDSVFYFGESVLLAPWRGRGAGHAFFDAREAHARRCGDFRYTAFCSVRRDPADGRAPEGYRPNNAFWRGRGYEPVPGMSCTLSWKEHGDTAATPHVLDFWMRELDRAETAA